MLQAQSHPARWWDRTPPTNSTHPSQSSRSCHICVLVYYLEDVGHFGISAFLSCPRLWPPASMWLFSRTCLPCCLESSVRIWKKMKGNLCLKSPKKTGLEKKVWKLLGPSPCSCHWHRPSPYADLSLRGQQWTEKWPCVLRSCTDGACLHSHSPLAGGLKASWEEDAGGGALFVQHE